jgi:hypothetical protein
MEIKSWKMKCLGYVEGMGGMRSGVGSSQMSVPLGFSDKNQNWKKEIVPDVDTKN